MIVLLSALGSITYFTFKDSISTSKKRIAELTLQNHVLGFHDLVEELQHEIAETLFATDLVFADQTFDQLERTIARITASTPYLADFVLTQGDRVVSKKTSSAIIDLQAALPDSRARLQHGLLTTGKQVWLQSPLPAAVGRQMAVYFNLDQEHVWETILHENSRDAGSVFFVTSHTAVIVSHFESEEHLQELDSHDASEHRRTGREHDHDLSHDAEPDHEDAESHAPRTVTSPELHESHEQSPGDVLTDDPWRISSDRPMSQLVADTNRLLVLGNLIEDDNRQMQHIGDLYVIASDLGLFDWRVFSVMSEQAFIADLIKLKNRIIGATALTFWIALGIVLLVAHRISSPLISLSAATRDIQEHNYSTPLNFVRRRDEIGDLADSFETMRQDIEQLIYNDALTGVFNRRYLLKTLNQQLVEGALSGKPVSFVMIDLDRFKAINDTHGHQAGDAMLKAAASSIAQSVQGIGILARYGGEEFCVVLPDTSATLAYEVAESIRQAMERLEITFDNQKLSVTCSLGIADTAGHERELAQDQVVRVLTSHADLALYHAKDSGRNRSVLYNDELMIGKAA